jgi:hypothetical protein
VNTLSMGHFRLGCRWPLTTLVRQAERGNVRFQPERALAN